MAELFGKSLKPGAALDSKIRITLEVKRNELEDSLDRNHQVLVCRVRQRRVLSVCNRPIYKLRYFIPLDKLSIKDLCLNPNPKAIEIVREPQNASKVKWENVASNPCDEAIDMLEKHGKLEFKDNKLRAELSMNPNSRIPHWINFNNPNSEKVIDAIVRGSFSKTDVEEYMFKRTTDVQSSSSLSWGGNMAHKQNEWPLTINNDFVRYAKHYHLDRIQWSLLAEKLSIKPCSEGVSLIERYHPILYNNCNDKQKYRYYVSQINDDKILNLLMMYPDSIDYDGLARNPNKTALPMLQAHSEQLVRRLKPNDDYNSRTIIGNFVRNLDMNPNGDTVLKMFKIIFKSKILCEFMGFDFGVRGFKQTCKCGDGNVLKLVMDFAEKKYRSQRVIEEIWSNPSDFAMGIITKTIEEYVNKIMSDKYHRWLYNIDDCLVKLSQNPNPKIFDLLIFCLQKIDITPFAKKLNQMFLRKDCMGFVEYCLNPERIRGLWFNNNTLVLNNINAIIDFDVLSRNPEIFVLDYREMYCNFNPLGSEIINYPRKRLERLLMKKMLEM